MADINSEFSAELLAPCGMNCALCSAYLAGAVPRPEGSPRMTTCKGCRPRGKMCAFIKRDCENLRLGKITYCYECATFPCDHLTKLDARYRTRYAYSMIDTLKSIRSKGVEKALNEQREAHKCPRCGGVICIHNGKCYACDEVKSWRG